MPLRPAIVRTLLFALGWWVIAEGETGSLPVAAAAIVAATGASLALVPPGAWRLRPLGLLRFAPFFLRQSLLGGLDVARRALDPRLTLRPALLEHHVRLPAAPARTFVAAVFSLFPGSLTVELSGERLTVHALDERMPIDRSLEELERRAAELFGV